MIIRAIVFAACLLGAYLLFAFQQWNLNPGAWGNDTRFWCAFFGVSAGIIGFVFADEAWARRRGIR